MTDDLKKPQLRAIQYFYTDGSFEFAFGLLCLLLGVYFCVEVHVQGWLSAVVDGSLVLVMVGGAWLINRLIKLLKERITYPRTGDISYRREQGVKRAGRIAAGLVLGGLVGATAAVLIGLSLRGLDIMPIFTGTILGLVLGFLGFHASLLRLYILGCLSILTGAALAFSGLESTTSLMAYYLATSLILFASGGVTLWRYLRTTPPPEQEQQ